MEHTFLIQSRDAYADQFLRPDGEYGLKVQAVIKYCGMPAYPVALDFEPMIEGPNRMDERARIYDLMTPNTQIVADVTSPDGANYFVKSFDTLNHTRLYRLNEQVYPRDRAPNASDDFVAFEASLEPGPHLRPQTSVLHFKQAVLDRGDSSVANLGDLRSGQRVSVYVTNTAFRNIAVDAFEIEDQETPVV